MNIKEIVKGSRYLRPAASRGLEVGYWAKDLVSYDRKLLGFLETDLEEVSCDGYRHTWCGYYDVVPFRPGKPNELLVHSNGLSDSRTPNVKYETTINLFDREHCTFSTLGSTRAWNWQQGSRLQWIDEDRYIMNKYDGTLFGVIVDADTREEAPLPCSVNIAFRNEYCLTLDYFRLTEVTEYGYPGLDEAESKPAIRRIEFDDCSVVDLVAYTDIAKACEAAKNATGFHVNHLLPNPTGERFVFLARYWLGGSRQDSLFCYEFDTGALSTLFLNQTVSHYAWLTEENILVWGVIDGLRGYFEVNIPTGQSRRVLDISDGHPFALDQNRFVSDIQEDWRDGILTLARFDLAKGARDELVSISHPHLLRKTNRCDMHVSLSQDGTLFQIDSRHKGPRVALVGKLP